MLQRSLLCFRGGPAAYSQVWVICVKSESLPTVITVTDDM